MYTCKYDKPLLRSRILRRLKPVALYSQELRSESYQKHAYSVYKACN